MSGLHKLGISSKSLVDKQDYAFGIQRRTDIEVRVWKRSISFSSSRCVFLKLNLRLETKPVAKRQLTHWSSCLADPSGLIAVGSYFILFQILC